MKPAPGRPRLASQELLQEAAFELFQVQGYRSTSIEQIAKTAGFSRATFFNFFSSKAELFWLETDALLASLRSAFESRLAEESPPALEDALLEFTETLGSSDIPWALQNFRLIEATDDLVASGAGRVLEVTRLFQQFLAREAPTGNRAAVDARAAVLTALLLTALLDWIDAGITRGSLRAHLEPVLQVVPQPLS